MEGGEWSVECGGVAWLGLSVPARRSATLGTAPICPMLFLLCRHRLAAATARVKGGKGGEWVGCSVAVAVAWAVAVAVAAAGCCGCCGCCGLAWLWLGLAAWLLGCGLAGLWLAAHLRAATAAARRARRGRLWLPRLGLLAACLAALAAAWLLGGGG